jgi:hypothetical protein
MREDVATAFSAMPRTARRKALALRRLILDTAGRVEDVGELTETLKWGEPAYLTEQSRSGSTIRIGWSAKRPDHVGLYFNCRTTLVDTFRSRFPELEFEGNRALLLPLKSALPGPALRACIESALTYHRAKR